MNIQIIVFWFISRWSLLGGY